MSSPLFSIVIPTYNRAELLKRCLDSVIAQTVQDWEAIVVDNYSEDNTEEVVNSFHDFRISYLKNHNYGVIAVSRNKALDLAKGQYVCFLDSDDAWYPNKLEMILPYMRKYDLVYHGYRKNIQRTSIFQHINWFPYDVKEPTVEYVIQRGDPFSPSCTCVSAKAIGKTRFDESKELFAVEDYDFFLQLLNKGITVKFIKKALTLYDMSGCSHVKESTDRDKILFAKWENSVTESAKKEFLLNLKYRDACYCRVAGDIDAAILFYKEASLSKIRQNRWKALKGLYKSVLFKAIKK